MKQWRIGTLSMGVSLIFMGIVLLMSQFQGLKSFDYFMIWWPMIFILIGLEIIGYIYWQARRSANEGGAGTDRVVKYDIFSIIFIGFIGTLCLMFFVFTATGIVHEVRAAVGAVEETHSWPSLAEDIPETIEKVVITSNHHVQIDSNHTNEMHVFGTYRTVSHPETMIEELLVEDVYDTYMVGDTLYVKIKPLPNKVGPFYTMNRTQLTISLPDRIDYELR